MMRPTTNLSKYFTVVSIFLLLASLAFPWVSLAAPNRQPAIVVRVVDGDTLKVRLANSEERLRLIGIDTPEKSPNDKALRDAQRSRQDLKTIMKQGKTASKHLEELLKPGQAVMLEFDVERYDRHGRLLAYVYDGFGTMINERMLKEGYAYPLTIPPNVRYSTLFQRSFQDAQKNRRGLFDR